MERVMKLVKDSPVIMFGHSSCCICHSIKVLLSGYGGNPAVYELDEMATGAEIEKALTSILGKSPPVPAVFVGGRLIGHNQDVMSLHMNGKLKQLLIDAGFIFL